MWVYVLWKKKLRSYFSSRHDAGVSTKRCLKRFEEYLCIIGSYKAMLWEWNAPLLWDTLNPHPWNINLQPWVVYIYICVCIYTYVHICTYICIYVYICTYIYICTSTSFKVAPQTEPRNHKLVAAHLYFRRQIYIYIYICIPLFGMLMCIIRYSICVDMRCSVLQCGRK